ncbi:response regulator transcription factor [Polaribacter haliotis]|uniref:Response regulator transcription factor n=1 Tax=Polaribacter haliotis TaxID=1888915 RepID=A0A7L8AE69_9FLAO|nr:response regulator transcription factor [Polaribacter haliotis]QOD60281.1 response regulator transcription factor [Polaribacter haliotis]
MSNHIKIYILEDEIITQELLKETLESFQYKVCGTATDAVTALKEIELLKPDIAILDIRVEGDKTGIWLGNQIEIPFIYLTAFNDINTIKKAIVTQPVSYLVKPFNDKDLFIAVELAISKIENTKHIVVKDRGQSVKVFVEDILYAKKEDKYISIHLKDSKRLIRSSINEFLETVDCDSFLQVHRSYVVNKKHIAGFDSKEIHINNQLIPISRSLLKEVLEEIS